MNEGKDRTYLRVIGDTVNTALAKPDPAQELAEALRKCLECACFTEEDASEVAAQSMLALIGGYARAALAKYEGSAS